VERLLWATVRSQLDPVRLCNVAPYLGVAARAVCNMSRAPRSSAMHLQSQAEAQSAVAVWQRRQWIWPDAIVNGLSLAGSMRFLQ
jgi:hypothetical protein